MRIRIIVPLLATAVLSACTSVNAGLSNPIVTIPSDRFAPAVTESVSGGTVTFHNADADAHTVTSLPGASVKFDLVIPSGATRTLKLSSPGTYRYFCRFHAHYDPRTDQVAANPKADHPDEPMAGVIVVARS
ncbi:MAG TPA: cupredoxin domain-containing protein [Candidatus Dormibacteraeota bacterium]|nr:cupredoxin domain-containing protein [Candidatus Dormibacteraeota bacterium]